MKFCSILLFLVSSVAAIGAGSFSDCKKDVDAVRPLVIVLDNGIKDFPQDGASLSDGIKIQTDVSNLKGAFDKAAGVCKGNSFSEAQSKSILDSFQSYTQLLLHLLQGVIDKKNAIIKINFPGIETLVRGALDGLHDKNDAFDNAWIGSSTVCLLSVPGLAPADGSHYTLEWYQVASQT
ncbi:hypothetical protein C0991_004399 [Blastosporella zonata]|nr:hypothetical protein C0991_004399 [Blastosporella zonata]